MVTKNGKIERWLIKQVASNLKVDSTNKEPTNQLGVGLHSSSDEWFSGVYISWGTVVHLKSWDFVECKFHLKWKDVGQ